MIDIIFQFGNEIIFVRVNGNDVKFANSTYGSQWANIDGLKINKAGAIKEHEDLKDNPDWKKISIERFKSKIKSLDNDDKRVEYIIDDLSKHGYKPRYKKKSGYRREVIK